MSLIKGLDIQPKSAWIFGKVAEGIDEYGDAIQLGLLGDLSPKNKPETLDRIDGALGEHSPFHQTRGFYGHGVSLETAAFPEDWKERTIQVQDYMDEHKIGWCVEAHDRLSAKPSLLSESFCLNTPEQC